MLLTDETVLVGTDGGEGNIYAFDQKDGSVRWRFPAGSGASTDLVRHGSSVYTVTRDDWMVRLDVGSGEERWRFETGADPGERYSMGSAPVVVGNAVIFGGLDGVVYALDTDSGRTLWKTDLGSQVVTSVLALGESVVVGTASRELHRLNAGTGRVEVAAPLPMRPRGHFAALDSEGTFCVYVAESSYEGELAAFEPSLAPIWRVAAPDSTVFTISRPCLLDTLILTGTQGGQVCALDAATGEVAWSLAIDDDRDWEGDGVRVCAVHESTLLVGTISGAVYAFPLKPR